MIKKIYTIDDLLKRFQSEKRKSPDSIQRDKINKKRRDKRAADKKTAVKAEKVALKAEKAAGIASRRAAREERRIKKETIIAGISGVECSDGTAASEIKWGDDSGKEIYISGDSTTASGTYITATNVSYSKDEYGGVVADSRGIITDDEW